MEKHEVPHDGALVREPCSVGEGGAGLKLYDYAESAEELRVKESWLRAHVRQFPRRKAGRAVHFTEADLTRINELLHLEPEYGPLAEPAPVPHVAGRHPLADLKPLPSRSRHQP
jgi:hypothetical protein